MQFQYASDQSLLVSLGAEINLATHARLRRLLAQLERDPIPSVRNLHPAYCSLLVVFDPLRASHQQIQEAVQQRADAARGLVLPPPGTLEIPVRYGGEHGPDLEALAAARGLSPQQVVELHSSALYTVYFLGFVPGFAYLGGLPEQLATPRLASPRKRVEPGSVGIAGRQTGVYPAPTPGGWQLIGRAAVEIFDPRRNPMSLLSLGDQVRFRPL